MCPLVGYASAGLPQVLPQAWGHLLGEAGIKGVKPGIKQIKRDSAFKHIWDDWTGPVAVNQLLLYFLWGNPQTKFLCGREYCAVTQLPVTSVMQKLLETVWMLCSLYYDNCMHIQCFSDNGYHLKQNSARRQFSILTDWWRCKCLWSLFHI